LIGAGGAETLTGTAFNDQFLGSVGADSLSGGAGDDVFLYNAGDVAAGEVIDGGAQTTNDIIQLLTGGAFDFSGATVTGVEAVSIANTGVTATFNGSQLRAGAIAQVAGVGAFAQGIIVNGSDVDLSGVTFSGWGGASQSISIFGTSAAANTLIGSSQKDTIIGTGSSADTITGGGDADVLTSGNGDDVFRIVGLTDVPTGETISGGGGTDTVRFAFDGVANLQGGTFTSIERLEFAAAVTAGANRATFNAGQFGPADISNAVQIVGDDNLNVIEVNLPSGGLFSAAAWTFTNWSTSDLIDIRGSGGNDTITGSSGHDQIIAGNGMDVVNGGPGFDSIFVDSNDVVAGESIDGGASDDSIAANGAGTTDLSVATIINVEDLVIIANGATVIVSGGQIGGSGFSTVDGSLSNPNQALVVNGNAVDLSGVFFSDWGTGKTITITGTGANATLIGSSQNDIIIGAAGTANMITGGAGVDTLTGNNQPDIFNYLASSDIVAGETINGGAAGTDTITLIGSFATYDFSVATLAGIDRFFFPSNVGTATLAGAQLGTGAITTVRAGSDATLSVTGANVDLSTVTFENWDAFDSIFIDGTAGVDDLTGSAQNDFFTVSAGADTMAGGGGNDAFVVTSLSQLIAGKTIDGEGGTDRLTLDLVSTADFTAVSISGIELLRYSQASSFIGPTAIFTGAQIGAGRISEIDSFFNDTLVVNGTSVDLSALTFTDWSSQDTIIINGTSLAGNSLIGSTQNDTINGAAGADQLRGEAGDDLLSIDASDTTVDGGDGNDTVNLTGNGMVFNLAFRSIENANGTAGNDQIDGSVGTTGPLSLNGLGGNDTLSGGGVGDTLNGGDGDDSLFGNAGADTINGGNGIDFINGGGDGDTIHGDGDNDTIFAEAGNDNIFGDGGNEFAFGGNGNDTMTGGTGTDYLAGDDNVIANTGITGQDTLTGGDDNDTLIGGYDTDNLTGEAGDDALYGDFDDVSFIGANPGSADTLTGGGGTDFMFGGGGDDVLIGGDDNDTLTGGAGNDRLQGDGGSDSLYGRNGNDTFVFNDGWGLDGVWDYTDGEDNFDMTAVTGLNTFDQLTITDNTFGGGIFAQITFSGNSINVVGVTAAQLDTADFLL
jgi:Ca2+-binding RTX toxin-like protein